MFNAPITTNAGRSLYLSSMAGGDFQITTIKMGSGSISGPIPPMTAMVSPVITMEAAVTDRMGEYLEVTGKFSNSDLAEGFSWREIAVFAANPEDPTNRAADIMVLYQNAYETADFIPAASVETVEKNITIPVIMSAAADISCTLSKSMVFVSAQDLEEHDKNQDAHSGTFVKQTEKGNANGVATLGSDGILTKNQRPKADGLYMPDGSTKISAKIAEIESERLLALAAAAPYSTSQTYAVGAYCTKNGKFYKANQEIPMYEEWTDAHWTETTIGAELAYIDGHAANMDVHVTPEDKQRWDESIQIEHIDAALPFTRSVRLASGNGIFVALAVASDEAAYSKDGARWTKTKLPTSVSDSWAVCYGNGKFVAIAYGSDVAIYSEDGVTWTQTTMPASLNWKGITYGGGKFVAIAYSSANFAYSEDGVTWTLGTMPAKLKWYSITYGAGKFVTIANSSAAAAYSEDGVTWTLTDLPSSTAWFSVAYGNGKFFAVPSNNNSAAYSEDGVTWTKQVTPSNKQFAPTITFGGGKFVIIYQGTNWVLCSEECKVWNKYLLPEQNYWRDITFGNGRFVTCAFTNGDSPNTAVALSDNGIAWNDFIGVIQTVTGTDVTEKAKEIVGEKDKLDGIESTDYSECYYRTIGDVKEWINPPIIIGVEYRTTERYLGKPVYVKLVDFASMPNNAEKSIEHGVENLQCVISVSGDSDGDNLIGNQYVEYVHVNSSVICIKTNTDRSSVTANVLLKYIKNTD